MRSVKKYLYIAAVVFLCALPLLHMPAQAATMFVEDITKGFSYTGTPNSIVFSSAATYTFRVIFDNGNFTLWQTAPLFGGATNPQRITSATLNINDQTIWVGGLTVTKTPASGSTASSDWLDKDEFSIVLRNVGSSQEGFIQSRKIMNTSGNPITRVTRNTLVSFELLVADPAVVATNYQKDSELFMITGGSFVQDNFYDTIKTEKVSLTIDGAPRIAFKVTIPRMRYLGSSNTMAFSLIYRTSDGAWRELAFTTEWSECVEGDNNPIDDWEEDDITLDPITPYIIVESYNYGGTSVMGGEDFELELILRNTSSQFTLQNVVMNISPTGVFNLTSSSNTYYLRNLFASSSTLRTVKLKADLNSANNSSETPMANTIELRFTYQYVANSTRLSGSSSETITIPVTFPDRLEINTGELPTNMYVGDYYGVYLPVINKGRTAAYNVSATIVGDVDTPGRSVYIGNVNNGEETSIDFDISFSSPGHKRCEVLITYEDANMNMLSKSVVFAVDVEEYPWFDPGPAIDFFPEEPAVTQRKLEIKPSAYVAGGGACVLSAYLTIKRAKAKRSEMFDETL